MQTIDQQAKEFIVNILQPRWLCARTRVWSREDYEAAMNEQTPVIQERIDEIFDLTLQEKTRECMKKINNGTCTVADLDKLTA